ncbi:hypothetical protein D7Z54_32350 [Salibacterium salarium]|uniref:Uncharacterized protein n=1 Tax=Salibacterium salarium TaxID=284579 RepID=A0A3R9R812_9BACI|nr:hypothetical protein [Salibacterium salarium]RSL29231.1 hypothetical protein D7Z54_32350 [Salibacterium salarium]
MDAKKLNELSKMAIHWKKRKGELESKKAQMEADLAIAEREYQHARRGLDDYIESEQREGE